MTRQVFQVLSGENLLESIHRSGVKLAAPCGGNRACGKCRVRVISAPETALSLLSLTVPLMVYADAAVKAVASTAEKMGVSPFMMLFSSPTPYTTVVS